ncbi:phosphopantetheine-binding protein, partial [Caballeronia sp. dw_276]|uniref:phosphopantetheine-binding protein n=1 Tax=Caballeronia sp. dw_276 TaxID=2719795 RepID=UPI001BD618B1
DSSRGKTGYVEPRTATERALSLIWAELLGLDSVGIHDNFFELGGHSLLAMRVASRLGTVFDLELHLRDLFEAPVVSELAMRIEAVRRDNTRHARVKVMPVARDGQ